jgi:hypothetical protein
LGCVFYELSYQRPPFNAFDISGLAKKIQEEAPPKPPGEAAPHYGDNWRALLVK